MIEGKVVEQRVTKAGKVKERFVHNIYGPSIREMLSLAPDLATLDQIYGESMSIEMTTGTKKKIRNAYLAKRGEFKVRLIRGL